MTCYDAYIGGLGDPAFNWDGGDWNANTPRRLGPLLPWIDHDSLNKFLEWAENESCTLQASGLGLPYRQGR